MDLGVIAIKEYSKFPRTPGLKFHDQLKFSFSTVSLVERSVVKVSILALSYKVTSTFAEMFFWVKKVVL